MATYDLKDKAIILKPGDDVAVLKANLESGTMLEHDSASVKLSRDILAGHKVALKPVKIGEPVRKYGQIIGFATRDIAPGEHVHVHNVELKVYERDYEFAKEYKPVDYYPSEQMRTFMGIKREGRKGAATRNYLLIVSTVNCSASVSRFISDHFKQRGLKDYPNVDGVMAITHSGG